MVGTSVPLHELMGETPPAVVLDLLSGLVSAALASGLDQLHPDQVRLGTGARVALTPWGELPPHPVTSAPELGRTGPGEATLVYAAAAAAALAALPRLSAPPPDRDGHVAWVQRVEAELRAHWAGQRGGDRAALILCGCLAWDRAHRPGVRRLLEDVRSLALPADEGLVRFTGACPPSIPGELPDKTPAPAPMSSVPLRPSFSAVSPSAARAAHSAPTVILLPPEPAPSRRVGALVAIGCALIAGMVFGVAVPWWLLAPGSEPAPIAEPDRAPGPPPSLPRTSSPPIAAPVVEVPEPPQE